ncbi:hypothetical protein B0A55_07521 [Friedmanniomyces simplex]|uniref:Uncharacterized protein n=1 Tax=Friedmanniomyces simplex TaxID=329884 RepID=A0A4U0X105_9PEZI|nr:hypothetical protein B0A55_07521 [Friedmanniomyces simplex]
MGGDLPQDDGLKWFGEGFDGFPKRFPDDCVEYVIHVIHDKLKDAAATRSRLKEVLKSANELCKKHTQDYIWQRDPFQLKLRPNVEDRNAADSKPQVQHLRGRTEFGDSVADEWLVVYLLLELSKQFQDAWIRVYDTDGEFLLIEAANALPKWLNPEIAEHRVWINNGHLRIIPTEESAAPRNLSLQEALDFTQNSPDKLIISPFIEDEAFYRLRDYPSAIASSLHHSLVTIPRPLAYLLHHNPAFISPAAEAFYLRDPVGLKPLATKDLSTLLFPPEDFVTVSMRFTRVSFAQLRSQLFDTPPAWTGIIPRLSDMKVEVGMKLACGFEMLINDAQNQDKQAVREMKLLLEDVESCEEALPTDAEISCWPRTEDNEKWLDIDYKDFEDELAGKKGKESKNGGSGAGGGKGFGDQNAQENLRKMVSRFEDFLNDDDAGAEGVHDDDVDNDQDEAGESEADSGEDENASFDESEFERAMKEMMGMPANHVLASGLLDEARKLALDDEKEGEEPDEDAEMKKVMELMEKELKGHGALNLDNDTKSKNKPKDQTAGKKAKFGPERPPGMRTTTVDEESEKGLNDDDSDVGPGDGDLSSDDEDYNDVDLGLAKNMLEAFKGQAGMAGPAGNLMKALGVNMPRDEADGEDK